MLTLEEAIKHCEEKAKELREQPFKEKMSIEDIADCEEYAEEYEQLVEWLKELKDYREGSRTCENCKYERKAETEYPCSICRCNHPNKFEWKDGAK